MDKKKIFVFGTGGLLGSHVVSEAQKDFVVSGSYNMRSSYGIKLDVTDFDEVEKQLDVINPDIIVNTCAVHNVDYCENHKEESRKVNVDFVDMLSKRSSKLVQISTDSVFDGNLDRSYIEDDEPNPPNVYGSQKLESEIITMKNKNNLVIRISVLYGWLLNSSESSSMKPNNFGKWLLDELDNEHKVKIVNDEFSSPILANDCAKSITHLIKGEYSGIYHSAPHLKISRYDFSVKLGKFFGYDTDRLIESISVKQLNRNVNTGLNKCLNSMKLYGTGYKFMDLNESFKLLQMESNVYD